MKHAEQLREEAMACDRRTVLGKVSAGAILAALAALISATTLEAQSLNFGRAPVGYPTTGPVCFCIEYIPAGQSVTVTGVSISGSGAANYIVSNDGCTATGKVLTGYGTPASCKLITTEAECESTRYACLYDIVDSPLHPGPLPAAMVTEELSLSNGVKTSNSFALQGVGGIIVAPVDSTKKKPDAFPLSTPQNITDSGTASITFTAANLQAGDTIAWKTTTAYTTGNKSVPSSVTKFSGTPNQSITQQFTGVGGKMTINATAENYTDTATVYIVGPPSGGSAGEVPYSLITSYLNNTLYAGVNMIPAPLNPSCSASGKFQSFPAPPIPPNPPDISKTRGLMTEVAMEESNYTQFVNKTPAVYGVSNFWPTGSGPRIGLMQVPTTMTDAWSWVQNAQDGVVIPSEYSIQCKLGTANSRASKIEAGAQNSLPSLDSCQLEEMALVLYGSSPPHPGTNLAEQYYTKSCVGGTGATCKNGSWQWTINKFGNLCGVCYVIAARNEVLSSWVSATKCQPPAGISADPPTNLTSECCARCNGRVNMTDLGCP
jgi:hypothetical protein